MGVRSLAVRPRVIGRLTTSFVIQEARSRESVFWMVVFPVFIFVFFGLIFGQSDPQGQTFAVAIDEAIADGDSDSRFLDRALASSEELRIIAAGPEEGRRMLAEGGVYAFITRGEDDTAFSVYVTEKNLPFASIIESVLDRFALETIRPLFRGRMPFEYEVEVLSYRGRELSYTYYLFAGVVGISMMMNCLFAIPQTIIGYRRQGFLKRFTFSPLRKAEFTIGLILHRIALGAIQVLLLVLSAIVVFGVQLSVAPGAFFVTFVVGTAAFSALGFFLSGIMQAVETAVAVAQIINMVLMFTAGVFFPLELMPRYFLYITRVNPVYYLSHAVYTTTILQEGLAEIGPDLVVLGGVFVFFFALTLVTFRYQSKQ